MRHHKTVLVGNVLQAHKIYKSTFVCMNVGQCFSTFLNSLLFIVVMGRGTARSSNQAPNNATQTKQKAHKQE